MKRQKNLTTEKAVKIEAVRTKVTTEHLQEWFEDLKEVVQKYDILPENIYNMDETGFNIGDSEARHVVVDTNIQSDVISIADQRDHETCHPHFFRGQPHPPHFQSHLDSDASKKKISLWWQFGH